MSFRYCLKAFWGLGIVLFVLAQDGVAQPQVFWDTVGTSPIFYGTKGVMDPDDEAIGLVVSNFGEYGMNGVGGVNLDYFLSGEECGTRPEDRVYLRSGSPFLLIASESGPNPSSVSLTTSIYQLDFSKEYSWVPDENTSPHSGLDRDLEWVYMGRMISRDTLIVIERFFFAPRIDFSPELHFVGVRTLLYSVHGQPLDHVTFGEVLDFDVPSDSVQLNLTAPSSGGDYLYFQGTDTVGHEDPFCLNAERYGGCALHALYSCTPWLGSDSLQFWGSRGISQSILEEVEEDVDGLPISPPAPDAKMWWQEIDDNPGTSGSSNAQNQAVFLTYLHDATITPFDTLGFWTILTTVRSGSLTVLENDLEQAGEWIETVFWTVSAVCSGVVGDANCNGEIAVSDIGALVDFLFISGTQLCVLEEADANQSGGSFPGPEDITVSDIAWIVDHLFITGRELPDCPNKLNANLCGSPHGWWDEQRSSHCYFE